MDNQPLTYEETPIIEPVPEPQKSTPPQTPKQKPNIVGAIVGFLVLFAIGFGLSTLVRQYVPTLSLPFFPKSPSVTPAVVPPEGEEEIISEIPQSTGSAQSTWKSYTVMNGLTRKAVDGVTFQLPPDVLSPICDGATCASQGTYLSGGTRFTVAARGTGQVLADFRNRIISDLSGTPFTVKETTVNGTAATEFTGRFVGNTVGGYAFSRMRGFMIVLSPDSSLEINHFTPNGIAADFDSDDLLFDQIVKTVVIAGTGLEKGIAPMMSTVSATPTLIASPAAEITE